MKRFDSVQGRINLIFLAFALLVMVSVGATFWGIQTQRTDALVINLAGRQRMLSQRITWLAMAQPGSPELRASVQLFDRTLTALRDGGSTQAGSGGEGEVLLPAAPDASIRSDLDEARRSWVDFLSHVDPLEAQGLQAASPLLLSQLDHIVSEFEARAEAKLRRVQVIQVASFLGALGLLAWGYALTRKRIVKPLLELNAATQRLAAGERDQVFPAMEQDEFGALGNAFESMRREIASAQDELEERVDRRTRELAAAFELSQEIVAQLDLDHLLRSVTQRAQALTNAWASSLCLLEGEERELVLVSNSGDDPAPLNLRQPLQRDPANRVVNTNETVALEAGRTQCAYLQARAPGQCAVAPLRAGDATLGALCVVRQAGAPVDADEQRALTLLANAAAVAISNARLAEAGKRHAEQAAVLSERERLAGELHDNLAQTLSFLNFQVEQMEKLVAGEKAEEAIPVLERMKSAIHGAYEQVRLALTGLSEPQPASGDFEQRLRGSLEEYRQSTGLKIDLEVADPSALELPRLAQAQVILILREALANVHKHAEAGEVHVRVECLDGQSRFIVEDDGRGFDPHTAQGGHHLGLRLMQARAERSGGTLEVESAPGEGTRVVVGFPNGAGEP